MREERRWLFFENVIDSYLTDDVKNRLKGGSLTDVRSWSARYNVRLCVSRHNSRLRNDIGIGREYIVAGDASSCEGPTFGDRIEQRAHSSFSLSLSLHTIFHH